MKQGWKWFLLYTMTVLGLLGAVVATDRAVTVFSENAPVNREVQIVIDPGHGGEDGGAVSVTGLPESRLNLEISLRLRDLLQLLGYDTRMIRTSDVSVYTTGQTLSQKKRSDLKERVRFIESQANPLVLSIHQNQFPDSRYSGPQVFYGAGAGSPELAGKLQQALVSSLAPGCSRKAKKSSGIYLMEHIRCPAVLIECGFLSNPEEEALLRDPDYQKKLCCVIAATVSEHLSNT